MGEKKTIHLISYVSEKTLDLIKQTDKFYKDAKTVVYQIKPWYLTNSSSLDSIEDIPFNKLDDSYGIQYITDYVNIMISINNENILLEFSMDANLDIRNSFNEIIFEWGQSSYIKLLGFETSIFLDRLYESIENITTDQSVYPLILIQENKVTLYETDYDKSSNRIEILKSMLNVLTTMP